MDHTTSPQPEPYVVPPDAHTITIPAQPATPPAAPAREPTGRRRGVRVAWVLGGLLALGATGAIGVELLGGDGGKADTATPIAESASASASASASGPPKNDVDAPTDPSALTRPAYTAYNRIKADMAKEGITLSLTSGKRSWTHQQELWEEELKAKGSRQAAMRRVLPPEMSLHVHGLAIDIAPRAAQTWLDRKGSAYGWCRPYDNEAWHYEYKASYTKGCPTRKAGPWE
ncbi:D-alanyl-D-alanine carboxypeptidase family protein [Embleya sp. NPDC008237]|uniref:D-alanyl-D-alanine carboxypeptidase family protein n=1 Tax=Embleya sp. NPDC008237 TaxID=3363978 RepID=UPI0036F10833